MARVVLRQLWLHDADDPVMDWVVLDLDEVSPQVEDDVTVEQYGSRSRAVVGPSVVRQIAVSTYVDDLTWQWLDRHRRRHLLVRTPSGEVMWGMYPTLAGARRDGVTEIGLTIIEVDRPWPLYDAAAS